MGRDYRKLIAWQRADALAMETYLASRTFPKEEIYGLTSQLRRAALSAPTNLAEGMARRTIADKLHFLTIAEASLSEAGYLLDFAHRLGYLPKPDFGKLFMLHMEAARTLRGLARRIETDPDSESP